MTKQTYILAFLIFLLSTGGYMAMPLFPLLTDIHSINLTQASTLTAIYIFTQKATPVILGPFGDIYGYKRTAIIGEMIRGIGFIGTGFVSDYIFLLLFSSLAGLGGGFASPSLQALIMKDTKQKDRIKISSLRASATNAGLLLGPILAGVVIWTGYFNLVFITAGCLYIAGAFLLILFITPSHRGAEVKKITRHYLHELLQNKSFLHLMFFMLMFYVLFAQLFVTLPEYAKQFTDQIQSLFLVNGITGLILQYPAGLLINKYRRTKLFMILGITLILLSFFILTLWENLIVLFVAIILFTCGEIIMLPIIAAAIANHSDKSGNMGLYFGISNLPDGIGRPIGSILGGWLLYNLHPSLVWIIFSLFTLTSLFYYLIFFRR